MNQQTKNCQNCKTKFIIESDDFDFYKKVKVPPPTFCPDCRLQRRMAFRNERSLYKDQCDFCKKSTISMYSPDKAFKVYCYDCWWSDRWDSLSYGRDYNFKKPFFEQFKELLLVVPRIALEGYKNQNSPFTNFTWFSKDAYLSPSTMYAENVAYSHKAWHIRDVFDSNAITNSELCYESIDTDKLANSAYLQDSYDCMDSYFLYDCANCKSCFMSSNLRNKSYVFQNQQLNKEDYKNKIKGFRLGSFSEIEKLRREFTGLREKALHRFAFTHKVVNVSGNNIRNSKNVLRSFNINDCENLIYCTQALRVNDCMDIHGAGDGGELAYEGINVAYRDSMVLFSSNTFEEIINVSYCDYCRVGSNLFGCIGLRKKHYCVLNKEYTKEEYEKLIPEIINHMNDMPYLDKKRRIYKYGEFFPVEISPFSYNETIVQEYFSLRKEDALVCGYSWKDDYFRNYDVLLKTRDLPDDIVDVEEGIIGQSIECSHNGECIDQCTEAFRIIPQEFQFYKKMNIPLPRLCPNCRHYQRLKQRNPLKLWHRKCQCAGEKSDNKVYQNTISHFHKNDHCPNEFKTTYSPDRKEIVYCEACYQQEVI